MPEAVVTDAVRRLLADTGAPWREVAPGEWGLSTAAGGWPLHVGIALRDGLVRAQAEVLGPGVADPRELLRRHRRLALVRFSLTRAGAVWAEGAVPAGGGVTPGGGDASGPAVSPAVERLLAELVTAADDLRAAHSA